MRDGERFFLRADGYPWLEVDEETWIQRERACGFHPKGGGTGRATGGFGSNGWIGTSTVPSNHEGIRKVYPDLPE